MSHQHQSHAATLAALGSPRSAGLVLASVQDHLVPDPQRHHPVAWFGRWAGRLERWLWRDSRTAGVAHLVVSLAPLAVAGVALERCGRERPALRLAATALTGWACLGGANLAATGELLADLVEDDIDAARGRLSWLCGRLPDELPAEEICRAGVESLAENTADAVVATLFWGAVAGVPGMLVHRGVNTLDAMVGHHNMRYENFGWAAARLDDAVCWLPARVTALLGAGLAPVVGGSPRATWAVVRRDAHDHPSPNGGWCESAWAGALGVQLGGRNVYPGGVDEHGTARPPRLEYRGLLGDGPRPGAHDLRRAARLNWAVQVAATAVFASVGGFSALIRDQIHPILGRSR